MAVPRPTVSPIGGGTPARSARAPHPGEPSRTCAWRAIWAMHELRSKTSAFSRSTPSGTWSRRAPHYRGGGVVFGPQPRSYAKAFPTKMRRLAMRSVLSSRIADDAVTVVQSFTLETPKTKTLLETLANLGVATGVVLVVAERSDGLWRAARNLDHVHVVT